MSIYKTTTTFKMIAGMTAPLRVVQGGKGSSKTISILQLFIFMAISKRENLIMSVVAQSLPNLKSGAMRDFEKILKDMGLFEKFKINRSDRTYEYGSNMIEFFSVDTEASRLGSRRTHLYVNELDNIKLDTFLELQGRTSTWTICDFNPRRSFWIHEDFIGDPEVEHIIVNFTHNEYIPQKELDSIMFYKRKAEETKSPFWINKWRVLGLGELGVVDGVIFEEGRDWDLIEKLPEEARYLGAGLDFGFKHVTAIVKLYQWLDPQGVEYIILHQSLFKAGMISSRIADHILLDGEMMSAPIPSDSARPEMIYEIRAKGCPVTSHKKREVMAGIDLMHNYRLLLTEESEQMVSEFRSYAYAKDRSGKSLGVPNKASDVDNSIDAARYAIEYFLSKAGSKNNSLRFVA